MSLRTIVALVVIGAASCGSDSHKPRKNAGPTGSQKPQTTAPATNGSGGTANSAASASSSSTVVVATGTQTTTASACENKVVGTRFELDNTCDVQWSCYQKVVTTCQQSDGTFKQTSSEVFKECVKFVADCR